MMIVMLNETPKALK